MTALVILAMGSVGLAFVAWGDAAVTALGVTSFAGAYLLLVDAGMTGDVSEATATFLGGFLLIASVLALVVRGRRQPSS